MLGNSVCRDRTKVESLAARNNSGEDFIRLSGSEDELYVIGWLFERLEQGIKGCSGEHVHLINVVDLKLAASRGKLHVFAKLAHLLDAIVRCTINF